LDAAGLFVVRGEKLGFGGIERGTRLLRRREVRRCRDVATRGGENEEQARGSRRAEESSEGALIHVWSRVQT
jgi:hypothetical protein